MPKTPENQPPGEGQIQGEGDYIAGRRFQDAERSFAEKGSLVERKAREAADAPGRRRQRCAHRAPARQRPRRDLPRQRPSLDLARRGLKPAFIERRLTG